MKHLKKFNEADAFPPRDFIQETIDSLKNASEKIQKDWDSFQAGNMTKEEFESEYHHVLADWLSEIESEEYTPNNGCKYRETKPDNQYFADKNY